MTSWKSLSTLLIMAVFGLAFISPNSAQECDEQVEDVFCELPEVVDAASTGAVRITARHLIQEYEVCKGDMRAKFRTADGTCNNIFNWGASARPPRRLVPNAYDDGANAPRTIDFEGKELPSAADVSRFVHGSRLNFQGFTIMLMQWGQFIDHDVTGFPITSEVNENIRCCGENGSVLRYPHRPNKECFPIRLSARDPRFQGRCMEFARSVAARNEKGKKLVPREQVNAVTSFVDGSMVYGSNQALQDALRESRGSRLGIRLRTIPVLDLLPSNGEENCIHGEGEHCFLAGDTRVNEQPGLQAIHTLFVRLHNIIAGNLKIRRSDDDETIFQLTRKIVIALIQNIHYGEWLPQIIGAPAMRRFGLTTGDRSQYTPGVDPRITNAFSTAAFRFGHSLIPDQFMIGNKTVPLREAFNRVSFVFNDFNDVLVSLTKSNNISDGSQRLDEFFTEEITNHLFETSEFLERNVSDGLDLVALNIQRGRDHGIPPYNVFRKLCDLPVFRNFSELPRRVVRLYKELYSSVDDIDLFSGMMSESGSFFRQKPNASFPQGIAGPTLTCLLGNQFHALKYGDRFFFEHDRMPEGFTDEQLKNIRGITLAHVCCQIKGIPSVQRNLFIIGSNADDVNCETLRSNFLNYALWSNF